MAPQRLLQNSVPTSLMFIVLLFLVILFVPALHQPRAEPLTVRYSDQSKYRDEGILRFVVEARDADTPIEGLDRAVWELIRGEKKLQTKASVSAFQAAGSSTSILIVVAGNTNFIPAEEEQGPDGKPLKKPIVHAVDALNSLRNNLGSFIVSVVCYNEVSPDPETLRSPRPASKLEAFTSEEVESTCRPTSGSGGLPRLPTLLLAAAQKWLRQPRPETLRYVMVVISDGNSEEPVQENWLRQVFNRFGADIKGWFELYVIGLLDGGDPNNLRALAQGGLLVTTDSRDQLPREAARITPLIAGTGLYDVNFTVLERVTGASVPLIISVQSTEGQKLASAPYALVNLERKTRVADVLLVALGVVIGILILLVLIKLVGAVIQARRRRREEEAMAAAQYRGPSRGRLIVRDGPAAGQTFHLVEDVTYIGRSPDNHISIPDPSVGKRHAALRIRERTYEIEDLQSTNGVFVNGQRVLKAFLKDGDSIRLGSTEMQFRL